MSDRGKKINVPPEKGINIDVLENESFTSKKNARAKRGEKRVEKFAP